VRNTLGNGMTTCKLCYEGDSMRKIKSIRNFCDCLTKKPLLAIVIVSLTLLLTASIVAILLEVNTMPDSKLLQGLWQPISVRHNGREAESDLLENSFIQFNGTEWVSTDPSGETQKGRFDLNEKASPKQINLTVFGDDMKTVRGIYMVEKNKLTVCFVVGDEERPRQFVAEKGLNCILATYQRKE
jgi:uncharacterized protein (TIGR03067 family)